MACGCRVAVRRDPELRYWFCSQARRQLRERRIVSISAALLLVILTVQLVCGWVRGLSATPSSRPHIRWLIAILGAALLAVVMLLVESKVPALALVGCAPFLIYLALLHTRDGGYANPSLGDRALLIATPILTSVSAIGLAGGAAGELVSKLPLGAAGVASFSAFLAASLAWRDFKNIHGMDPEPWDDLSPVAKPPRVAVLSDSAVWARILLECATVVLLFVSVANSSSANPVSVQISLPAALSMGAAVAFGGIALIGSRLVGHPVAHVVVCVLATASAIAAAASVIDQSVLMLEYSVMSPWAVAYRVSIGALIAAIYFEDFLVSFYLLNRYNPRVLDLIYGTFCAVSFGTIFVFAASVSYSNESGFKVDWIIVQGTLISWSFVASTLSWKAVGNFVPAGKIITLKGPRDIALSDNAMYIALLGGCVAGASLVSNGRNPIVAAVLGGLIIAFIQFAVGNDKKHLANEKTRLRDPNVLAGRNQQEKERSLVLLKRHLAYQEWIPRIIVGMSFLWALAAR